MSNNSPLSFNDSMMVIQYAVRKLPGIWNSPATKTSALRSTFRRWNPGSRPLVEMRQHVWNIIFQSMRDNDQEPLDGTSRTVGTMKTLLARHTDAEGNVSNELAQLVDKVAVIVALRAVAGEQERSAAIGDRSTDDAPTEAAAEQPSANADPADRQPRKRQRSLGHALQEAGMTDLRFMRLMTTPREGRREALHRALRLLAAKSAHFDWAWPETRRIVAFLYGSEEHAQQSINYWTADFLATRAHDAAMSESEPTTAE